MQDGYPDELVQLERCCLVLGLIVQCLSLVVGIPGADIAERALTPGGKRCRRVCIIYGLDRISLVIEVCYVRSCDEVFESRRPRVPLYWTFLSRCRSVDITSHYITSHHITSHYITSHHLTSPHLALPHLTLPHLAPHHTSHYITLHHIISHHITLHDMT